MKPMNPMVMMALIMESRPKTTLLEERDTISVVNPKAGIIKMYTSGWPKNQNTPPTPPPHVLEQYNVSTKYGEKKA
jgi:hypothetical protein